MIRNAENRYLLSKDKHPKTNSGQSLQGICLKYSLKLCEKLLKEKGYFDVSQEQQRTKAIQKNNMRERKVINGERISQRHQLQNNSSFQRLQNNLSGRQLQVFMNYSGEILACCDFVSDCLISEQLSETEHTGWFWLSVQLMIFSQLVCFVPLV